jgi:peptidyl-prolyl cis-trans isomerase SurA
MRKQRIIVILLAFALFAFQSVAFAADLAGGKSGGKTKSNKKDPALLVFPGKDTVHKSDFEYVYQKNNGGWEAVKSHSQEQLKEYLALYINFKRKVLEAQAEGLQNSDAFKNEFEGYRKQLAQPYLVDKNSQEELVHEAYDRGKEIIGASHILIACGPDATPEDTMKAFKKISAIRDSIVNNGKDFSEMAGRHSTDPSARSNKGDLGYFSVFDMVYPFESGAYKTKVGEVSKPVRSSFGYHLIKVYDRVPNTGKKTAAHIIIRVGAQYTAKTEEQAKAMINEIEQKLKAGADWNELCEKYSDDPNTAKKGGALGQGRLIPEMETYKRKLGANEFSEPFTTSFGHHILKVTEVEPVKSFDESAPELKSRIARDARSTLSRERLISRVKKEYNFQMQNDGVAKFVKAIDDQGAAALYTKGFWKPVDSLFKDLYNVPLYTMGDGNQKKTGTIRNYIDWYINAHKGFEGASTKQVTDKLMPMFVEQEVLNYEELQLPKKYREYRELLKEYRDGILLFTLTEDKVWRKAVEDTTGLKQFYADNKSKFTADERVSVTEYSTGKKEMIEEVQKLLAAGKTEKQIDEEINKSSALNIRIRTQSYEKFSPSGDNQTPPVEAQMFGHQPGFKSDIIATGNNYRILVLQENLPAGQKTFEEAKSECITQYQNYLEAEWLKDLEAKYPVEIKEKVLAKLYK